MTIDGGLAPGKLLGLVGVLDAGRATVLAQLRHVERWCRLHLPSKFFTASDVQRGT